MILELFPTQIYVAPLVSSTKIRQRLLGELKGDIEKISRMDKEGHQWSQKNYPGGYTSYSSLDKLHQLSPYFRELQERIDLHRVAFVKALEMDINPKELQMTSCWVNVMPAKVTHTMHLHPLSVISGTFYVEVPKGAGDLKFEDPRNDVFMASPPRKLKSKTKNQRFVNITPKPGQVVLFESWQRHEVLANQSQRPRVSISFNYDWIR